MYGKSGDLITRKEKPMKSFISKAAGIIIITLMIAIIIAFIAAIPTMLLWNWVISDIFALPEITLKQALGLNLLCAILFNSPKVNNKKE